MHKNIILVAETGSDIPKELADKLGIYLVPMHVTMGGAILDDGTFPAEDVCAYYDKTGKCPTTSGSTPFDFEKVLDEIHAAHPDKKILHLAYSAVTTCSYQSCIVASEGRDYVKSIDTKHVSVGQAAVVLAVQKYLVLRLAGRKSDYGHSRHDKVSQLHLYNLKLKHFQELLCIKRSTTS